MRILREKSSLPWTIPDDHFDGFARVYDERYLKKQQGDLRDPRLPLPRDEVRITSEVAMVDAPLEAPGR